MLIRNDDADDTNMPILGPILGRTCLPTEIFVAEKDSDLSMQNAPDGTSEERV
jgi:hypothetical protein